MALTNGHTNPNCPCGYCEAERAVLFGGRSGVDLPAWRKRLNMTQAQLADALGVPANTLARWERGELAVAHPRILELALQRLER